MRRSPVAHWELGVVLEVIGLGVWLSYPGIWPAVAAVVGGSVVIAAGVAALRTTAARPSGPGEWVRVVVVSVLAVAGAAAALRTTLRVTAVELQWPEVREELIGQASARLDATLRDAVGAVNGMAATAAAAGGNREEAFRLLAATVDGPGPERGVILIDSGGPWAWAGRQRVPWAAASAELFARITPYYAVLLAQRQTENGRVALAHVVLAADSAVPDRDGTVAERFSRATGAQLTFFAPGSAPPGTDVFDYCLPSCRAVDADTLFSVLTIPPAQGAMKLSLLGAGARTVAWMLTALLAALMLLAPWLRAPAIVALITLAILTPLAPRLGVRAPFSAGTYFVPGLGPLTASAGALLLSGVLLLIFAAAVSRDHDRPRFLALLPAAGGIAAAPALLAHLANGITPPLAGVPLSLWLVWQLAITVVGAAVILSLAALVRWAAPGRSPVWMSWLAGGWATIAAVTGVFVWQPDGFGDALLWLWIPPLVIATQPAPRLRSIMTAAVVAGTAAAMLTWGAVRLGQLRQAERDAAGLGATTIDPVTYGLLEQFGAQLAQQDPPQTTGALYSRWARTALHRERYPAVLAFLSPERNVLARLDLADVDLPDFLLQSLGQTAIISGRPRVERVARVPGQHYVLSIPYADGSLVVIGVGPRSRYIEPTRVARFLTGDPGGAPYQISLTPPRGDVAPGRVAWRRERWVVRGDTRVEMFGVRHVHIELPLDGPGWIVTRGVLLVLLDVVVVGLLGLAGAAIAGQRARRAGWGDRIRRPSYRMRLSFALGVFFVAPTLVFAGLTAGNLRTNAQRSSDLLIEQSLRDALKEAVPIVSLTGSPAERDLRDLASSLDAELVLYEGGVLEEATLSVVAELGLIDRYLPPDVYRQVVLGDMIEMTADALVAGRETRVGYLNLGTFGNRVAVLAAPRLAELPWERGGRSDLAYGLLLGTLAGLAAAAILANFAARSLARPVQALRVAAERVGRGDALPPLDPQIPAEFVPVSIAFERMAQDVASGRAALETARQRMAGVLRHVATGVIALDPDLRATLVNPRAEELLGTRLRPGTPVKPATADAWVPVWTWVTEFLRGNGEIAAQEFAVHERRIRAQVSTLGADRRGCVVALEDTTEMARAMRVLAWGELARQIAHEIKNPLTPIRLGVQHLRRSHRDRRPDFDSVLERTSDQILAEIERLDAIARAFARFGAPAAEAGPLEAVDLAAVAAETAQLYSLGGDTRVTVLGETGIKAVARRDEFKEVLVNLIENARDAGATGVSIGIGAGSDARTIITIADDGRGIPAADLPRIFEPQFSTTTSGTGLGLAICRRLVQSWGGTIEVGSVVGRGTTVSIMVARSSGEKRMQNDE